MTVRVTSAVLRGLLAEARAMRPREACGLLFGSETAVTAFAPAANLHPTPNTHFEIAPQALIDAHRATRNGGPRLVGYYHSHPSGSPEPSATDRALAAGDGMIWAIVGEDRVALWRAGEEGLEPLPYRALQA
jgi:proteasome lid subunit RPN8/RPN11